LLQDEISIAEGKVWSAENSICYVKEELLELMDGSRSKKSFELALDEIAKALSSITSLKSYLGKIKVPKIKI
jgi:hypothetical protein